MTGAPPPTTGARRTPAATLWVDADGIHRVRLEPVRELTLAHARAMHEARLALGPTGRGRLVLVDIAHRPRPTREARAFTTSPEALALTGAMALVTRSAVIHHLGNAFLAVTRPDFPTRIFRDEDAAVAWLLSQPT